MKESTTDQIIGENDKRKAKLLVDLRPSPSVYLVYLLNSLKPSLEMFT